MCVHDVVGVWVGGGWWGWEMIGLSTAQSGEAWVCTILINSMGSWNWVIREQEMVNIYME